MHRSAWRHSIPAREPSIAVRQAGASVAAEPFATTRDRIGDLPREIQHTIAYSLIATNGWIRLPGMAEPVSVVGLAATEPGDLREGSAPRWKGRARTPAPILTVDEGQRLHVSVHDIGFRRRPDLVGGYRITWSGPETLQDIPATFHPWETLHGNHFDAARMKTSRSLRFTTPGTYLYSVEFDDGRGAISAVQGLIIVRPRPDCSRFEDSQQAGREFVLVLGDLRVGPREPMVPYEDCDPQQGEPDCFTINGRSFPDTIRPSNDPTLEAQPISSLMRMNEHDTALLRFANTGRERYEMEFSGLLMQVRRPSGVHAGPMSYEVERIAIRPGRTLEARICAPAFDEERGVFWDGVGSFNRYLLANPDPRTSRNGPWASTGAIEGMATELRVYRADSVSYADDSTGRMSGRDRAPRRTRTTVRRRRIVSHRREDARSDDPVSSRDRH